MFGPVYNIKVKTWERRRKAAVQIIYGIPKILVYSKKMEWFGHGRIANGKTIKRVSEGTRQKTLRKTTNKVEGRCG